MLPPREGFSPDAVGAVGLLVHRLSAPDDLVVGRALDGPPFPDRRYRSVRPSRAWPPSAAARYAAAIADVLRAVRPVLVEVHNRPEVARLLARRLPGIPVALFLHNDPQAMRGARTPRARRALARRVRVVAVSEHLRRRYLDGLARTTPVAVLPNCLDLDALPPAVPPAGRDRTILFAGRLVADKGADGFVAACARALPFLPGWRAEMIGADRFHAGAPETPFLARLRREADAAGVVLAGYRPHPDVLAAMSRAAIVVVPSRWPEPFGLTALEAMACGAALLAAPRGGLAELVAGASLPVDPDDPDALADTLRRVAGDAPERARLAEAGLRRAAQYGLGPARAALASLRRDMLRHRTMSAC